MGFLKRAALQFSTIRESVKAKDDLGMNKNIWSHETQLQHVKVTPSSAFFFPSSPKCTAFNREVKCIVMSWFIFHFIFLLNPLWKLFFSFFPFQTFIT